MRAFTSANRGNRCVAALHPSKRCLLVAIVGLLGLLPVPLAPGQPAAPLTLSPQAGQEIAAIQQEKESWTPVQRKMSSHLVLATKRHLGKPMAAGMPAIRSRVQVDAAGKTLVDITAEVSDALLARIQALGGDVVNAVPPFGAIRARVPIAQMEALSSEASVQSVCQADVPFLNKVNTSQGDVAHRANTARATFGVDGTGVTVGVLSDSVDSLATLQASGDLPFSVTVLASQSGNPGTSEGTAMLEIVYDLAPGANLYFATANGGTAAFASNILALQAAGCKVIVDDVGYFGEPVFQDGVVAQAVETVSAAGVLYLSAAGNGGNKDSGTSGVWEGDFVPIAAPAVLGGTAHDFGGGASSNTVTVDSPSYFTLQWSDPWGASANDYDLYLLDSTLTHVLDASTGAQTGTQNPFEAIDSTPYNDTGTRLVIIKFAGANRYLHLNANRGRLSVNTVGQTWGHSAAASAYSVAAVNVATAGGGLFAGGAANPVEAFSSDGPRHVFYYANGAAITPANFSSTGGVVRQKPDIAAADGVATATPPAAYFNPFFGTSAAAPHAAAIAALLLSYKPLLTPAAARTAMTGTALDIMGSGLDRDSGYGIVDAVAVLRSVDTTPPKVATVVPGRGALINALPSVVVTFSESVTGVTRANLTVNGSPATSVSGSGGGPYTFTGYVAPTDGTVNVVLAAGAIKDPGSNPFTGDNWRYTKDSVAPTVTNVTSSAADGTYYAGASLSGTSVTFSKTVVVTSTPLLTLNVVPAGRTISYVSGSGTSTLTFANYIVQVGDSSAHLDYTSTGALSLNGGTIKDGAGNNAILALPALGAVGSLGTNKNIVINGARLVGDLNGDGHVDSLDLLILAGCWAKTIGQPGFNAACDLNSDGVVNVIDLLFLADNWGM